MLRKTILLWASLLLVATTHAQQRVRGTVVDAHTYTPLPGATITGDDGKTVVADENGIFEWTAGATLTVSNVGYLDRTLTVKPSRTALLVFMEPSGYQLNTIKVTGWSAGKKDGQLDVAKSVGILTTKDLNRGNGLYLENALNLLAGVDMQSRTTSGGQRISIRGYGNNTNFNGQGAQVYLDNIPLTDATGTTLLDDIDFTTIGKAEVFKGPQSSLYGSGIAGTVVLHTLQPPPGQTRVVEDNTVGSYGLWRNNTRIETAGTTASVFFNYGHQESNGFRTNSADRKDYLLFSGRFFNGERSTLSTYFSYAHSVEQLAGEMTDSIFYHRIVWSDPAYLANRSLVDIESFRTGATDEYKIDPHFSNLTTVFMNGYTLNQPFAHGLTDNQAFTFGGRTGFVYAGKGVNGILGAQFEKTVAFNKSYNLTNDTLGTMRGDLQNGSMTYNVYTEWKFTLPEQFILTAGASLNFTEFGITDMMSGVPGHANQSGYKHFSPALTPRLSLLKGLGQHLSIYADVSAGYTPPPTSDVVIAAIGKVNTGLDPERGIQYELGAKGDLLHRKLSFQLALFDLDVNDKITPETVPAAPPTPTYTYYVNVGRQQDLGAELSVSYALLDDRRSAITLLRPFLTYAWSDFRYRDFKSDNNDNAQTVSYSGNKVAGVAPSVLNLGLDLETQPGFYAYVTYRYVGRVPYTFDNLNYARAFSLLSAKVGYKQTLARRLTLDVAGGGDNLLSNTVYSFLFYSGNLAGTTDPHFLPLPYNATWYGSLKLAYAL